MKKRIIHIWPKINPAGKFKGKNGRLGVLWEIIKVVMC